MNGITEPLPGLLDDPQFQIADLPAFNDFHIAPLRDPAPSRHLNLTLPLPLEPVAENGVSGLHSSRAVAQDDGQSNKRETPKITPSDVLSAREAKKPHLAISELVDSNDQVEGFPLHLPSFVSLAVVERSPIQSSGSIHFAQPSKRLRLDIDGESLQHEVNRHLPRPAQKDGKQPRPAPLLPAMVTGLHEPPPSAALLPSMDLDVRGRLDRTTKTKIQMKDILTDTAQPTHGRPPELMVNSPEPAASPPRDEPELSSSNAELIVVVEPPANTNKDGKLRRARKRWTDEETHDLLAGVKKHGVGKWKQILEDESFSFHERSSVDLKDRYRVCVKDDPSSKWHFTPPTDRFPPTQALSFNAASVPNALESPSTDTTHGPQQQQPQRRKRRAWTMQEDDNLLKGVTKHGFQWTTIHQDPELDLLHRRATDLRDRIRNKFPDGYKHADTAPLKSEQRKADKVHKDKFAKPASAGGDDGDIVSVTSNGHATASASGGVRHDAQRLGHGKDKERATNGDEQVGLTLPSLTLEDDDMSNWEDNRLPPMLEYNDIGF